MILSRLRPQWGGAAFFVLQETMGQVVRKEPEVSRDFRLSPPNA